MSKPKFDPSKPFESAKPRFDPSKPYDVDEPSTGEAILRGGAQGATMGYIDEVAGTAKGMWDDAKALFSGDDANNGVKPEYDEHGNVTNGDKVTGDYKKYRDEYRENDAKAKKAHPIAYGASEIAGTIATSALLPGSNTIRGGTIIGGAQGLGMSDSDDATDLLKDTAIGAGVGGAASYAVPKVINAGKNAAGYLGKKAGSIVFGVGDEATEKYLQNPEAIRNAKPLKDVTDQFLSKVDEVSSDTSRQSGESFKELSKHHHDIATVTDPLIEGANRLKEMGAIGQDRKSAIKFLEGIADDVAEIANGDKVSLDKGKQVLSVLDAEIKKMGKKDADTQAIKALTEARKNLDNVLKEISPEYKGQMTQLADDTRALTGIGDKFRTEGGAEKMLQRIGRGKDQYNKEALEKFDDQFGTEFSQDLQDAAVKNQFTRETTNGSRRTVAGAVAGGAIGSILAPGVGTVIGPAIGAAAGATIDKVGGRIWQAVLDGTLKVGPYAKILEDAAKRGPTALGVTHYMLMKKHPDYREAVEGQQ